MEELCESMMASGGNGRLGAADVEEQELRSNGGGWKYRGCGSKGWFWLKFGM